MPRPCKRRRVCALPGCRRFGSLEDSSCPREPLVMTVDEFETIRLLDLVGLTQEEAARQMGVARATVQVIYNNARKKLALCLTQGRELQIQGGQFEVCPGPDSGTACPHCPHQNQHQRSGFSMKIAVTYENGQVFQHFGHTAQFKIYEAQEGKVVFSQVVDTNGSGHGALAGFLREQGVDTLICGGIGGGARTALAQAGIQLFGGVSGSADQAVEDLLAGKLQFQPDILCSHHGQGHSCGEGGHSCGEGHGHTCGHGC